MSTYTKWVACHGNATSIADQTATTYTKNLTLRYPVYICFSGDMLRFRFSNVTGTEPVTLEPYVAKTVEEQTIDASTSCPITFQGQNSVTILPGTEVESDELPFEVIAGDYVTVSIYLSDYTQMNAGTLITGPLSKGFYSYGDFAASESLPLKVTRATNWFYFLNTIDIHTSEENYALVCYGDSITAQDWPDYLALRCKDEGYSHVSIIRRAISGTRILRDYDCITYAAYGAKGAKRFPVESKVTGMGAMIIQHGINDIIHPVGVDVNPFRPWEDLPTTEEMKQGLTELYFEPAKEMGIQVWAGTLLPIHGWRTYAPFREELKNEVNNWLRTNEQIDGCIDFDKTVRDEALPERFKEGYDSGDHLHPSKAAYKAMAMEVPSILLGSK